MPEKSIPFTLLLLLCPMVYTAGSDVVIHGRAPDYAGDTLEFLTYSDMISFTENAIGLVPVDDSGYFECSLPIRETRHVFTYLGIYNCYLYAQPGKRYDIKLPARRDKSLQDLVNPYFEETAVHLSVKSSGLTEEGSEPELNFLIRAFNDSFYPYYYKFVIDAYGSRVDRQEIQRVAGEVRAPFDSVNEPFLQEYIDYRLGLLYHYGSQVSTRNIIRDYFLDKPVLTLNPAYMELFNEIYKDYFITFATEYPGQRLPQVLNHSKDYTGANRILAKEAELSNDTLREIVLLKGLYDGFYDGKNIPSSMIQLLDSVKYRSSINFNQEAAVNIMRAITRVLPGYSPPDFALYNSDSVIVRLSDYRGEYVYLNFCNSFGYYCVREYEYLRVLHQRLGDKVRIVTILVDDSFSDMQELVRSNNYPWSFLHFSNQPDVVDNYDLRSYPSYFLIGPEGKLVLSPAPSPIENFESTFLRISGL